MDLNLYLGLPHSPIRRGSDLGSDLALGSIPLTSEEIYNSTEMSGFIEPVDSHAPYSPTHASYTPDHTPVDPLDPTEIQIPSFEYSPFRPPPSYRLVLPLPRNNSNGSSDVEYTPLSPAGGSLEYSPSSPSYTPTLLPVARETHTELLHQDDNDTEPYTPYSPSYAPILANGQESSEPVADGGNNHVEYVPSSPSYGLDPENAPGQRNESLAREQVDFHTPYSPSYTPTTLAHDNDSISENPQPSGAVDSFSLAMRVSDPLADEDPSQQGLLQYPEVRFRRLIESSRRWQMRRFRSTASYRADVGLSAALGTEDPILQEIMASERSVETSGSHKVAECLAATDREEDGSDQESGAANFECNICLDMARDPVVTSCGHLFCWPCLYQWLHLHSEHKECPVCKGEVTESNITPIYGRGSSETAAEKTGSEIGGSSLKVPPRPRGHRFESLRQQLRRPFSRRLGHQLSWRRIVDEEIRNGNQVTGQEPAVQGIFHGTHRRVLTGLRAAQRLQREASLEIGSNFGGTGLARNNNEAASSSQNGGLHGDGHHGGARSGIFDDFWHHITLISLPIPERIAALSSFVERMTSIAGRSSASASANPPNPEPLHDQSTPGTTPRADQASASSTMAVIQGDVEVLNTSGEAAGAGSSRSLRRRRRNGASSSLDVDGGVHHAHKRRRLN